MERGKFIGTLALGAIGISTFGKVKPIEGEKFKGDCQTTNDILGPFYRVGSPKRSSLLNAGIKGAELQIAGQVFGKDCIKPLAGYLVEIWQCDTEGNYDNTSDEFRLRGSQLTNAKGEYKFTTIFPGKYLNGKEYRPAHIHFRISKPNGPELISQIYFQNDPSIVKDQWASHPKAKQRIVPLFPIGEKGGLGVNFNIYMNA
ncbi:MAG: hypothetical protein N4A46_07875 [Schleiferiaceae bacterium]|jgi:protocatechuate 3,4-dioxygenase beta subunit|nr:hypothetical protein [Schleiferiaceae bacterium]